MDLKRGIRNPSQLREVIEMAKQGGEGYQDAIWAIHKYKWYNWYQCIHIKEGTPEDSENTLIFEELKREFPMIHADVENNINYEIEKLNNESIQDF